LGGFDLLAGNFLCHPRQKRYFPNVQERQNESPVWQRATSPVGFRALAGLLDSMK
jgi:hypothetical protein